MPLSIMSRTLTHLGLHPGVSCLKDPHPQSVSVITAVLILLNSVLVVPSSLLREHHVQTLVSTYHFVLYLCV